jgi:hypothetical protein
MRYLGIAIVPIIALLLLYLRPLNVYLLGLFFIGFVGLVIFVAYRSIYSGEREKIDQQSREKSLIGYSLYCRNCGHSWEMTPEEWEAIERTERENFIDFPSRLPSSQSALHESLERIEWKPPNPSRGVLIVTGFIGLSLIVSFLLFGVFWAKAHKDNPYVIIVNGIVVIFALLIYTGLTVIFKPKANKLGLILVILITLIGLVLAALNLFLA